MKILFSADWHIKLGQKNVPQSWQKKRFHMLVKELNKAAKDCDLHIIGGDILDSYDPSTDEIELYFDLISNLDHRTEIFSGNHEMRSKTRSLLHNLTSETSRCNPLVTVITEPVRSKDFDCVDYIELHKDKWQPQVSDLCFTHVRGSIPPHVTPEIELSKFDIYKLVISGDLHSYKNSQSTDSGTPIIYPGSPLTTTFHSSRTTKTNGYIVVDTDTLEYTWHELGHLPQLIRKKINAGDLMVADDYDRVVYEVSGDVTQLASLGDSELLDKKVNKNVGREATLDLSNTNGLCEELNLYFKNVAGLKVRQIKPLISRFKKVIPDAD